MKYDLMGTRMKEYEHQETERRFLPGIPVYCRLDGRGFSNFTRGAIRPFDPIISQAMVATATQLVEQTHALIAFTQSDEISLAWITRNPEEEMFFGGKIQKLTSVLASLATASFINALLKSDYASWVEKCPHFDARIIQIPTREETANMFLWREMDARKNAISMAAHSRFSPKSLHGQSGVEKLARLEEDGVVFDDYPVAFRRGTFLRRVVRQLPMGEDVRLKIPERNRPQVGTSITRSVVEVIDMPRFDRVENRAEVIFDGADPLLS